MQRDPHGAARDPVGLTQHGGIRARHGADDRVVHDLVDGDPGHVDSRVERTVGGRVDAAVVGVEHVLDDLARRDLDSAKSLELAGGRGRLIAGRGAGGRGASRGGAVIVGRLAVQTLELRSWGGRGERVAGFGIELSGHAFEAEYRPPSRQNLKQVYHFSSQKPE